MQPCHTAEREPGELRLGGYPEEAQARGHSALGAPRGGHTAPASAGRTDVGQDRHLEQRFLGRVEHNRRLSGLPVLEHLRPPGCLQFFHPEATARSTNPSFTPSNFTTRTRACALI